jgi:ABC-type hemin transport system substrate-binding protein
MSPVTRLCAAARLARCMILSALALTGCSRVEESSDRGPARPQRIVAASATAVDYAVALAGLERMVGLPQQAVDYSVLHEGRPEPGPIVRFDAYLAEPILALRPDCVLIDPWQSPETSARLREVGVRVVTLPSVRGIDDALRALEWLGVELGDAERAAVLGEELRRRIDVVRNGSLARRRRRALAYSNFGGAGSTAGAGTTLDSVFEVVGLDNAMAARGLEGHGAITFEDLLALDPDLIVVSAPLRMGEGTSGDRGGASERLLRGEPSLVGLRALRENQLIALPAWLFATGSHELVAAAEELARRVEALDRGGATEEPRR